MGSQLLEYGDWREENNKLSLIRKNIASSWDVFLLGTEFEWGKFPWWLIDQYRKKDISLEEIALAYQWKIDDGNKNILCENIFLDLYPKFIENVWEKTWEWFQEYTNQLESINSDARIEDLMRDNALEIQETLVSKQQKKKDHAVKNILLDAFPDVEVVWLEEEWLLYTSEEEKFLSGHEVTKKRHKELVSWYTPTAELRYLAVQRERYEDYLDVDIEKHGIHRSYNQIKSNLRYMHTQDFVHFPSHSWPHSRLEDAWETNQLVHLEWETGTWKTELAKDFIREKTGKEPILIKCDPSMLPSELYGKYKMQSEEGQGQIMLKFITEGIQKWMEHWRGVILDEWDQLPGDLKWPLNGLIDQLKNKWKKTEIHGDGWDEILIHQDWMIVATSNYWPQYMQNSKGTDISTKDRMTTERLPYPTERELGYYLISKCMNRQTMKVTGDKELKSCLTWLPAVMSIISWVINQWTSQNVQKNTVLQDLLLRMRPMSMRRLKSWIDMVGKGRWSLRELCEQTIDQYKPDEKVQKLFMFSLFLDAWMGESFKATNTNAFTKLTEITDPLARLEKIAGSGNEVDEIYTAYESWKLWLPVKIEKMYDYEAIQLVSKFHEEARDRDDAWDKIMWWAESSTSWTSVEAIFDVLSTTKDDPENDKPRQENSAFEEAERMMLNVDVEKHQKKVKQWIEKQDSWKEKLKSVYTRAKELIDTGTVHYGEHAGYQEMVDTSTWTAFRLQEMKPHSERTKWDYDDWENEYKSLADYRENDSRFYDASDVKDAKLIFKWVIDGANSKPKQAKQFVEQLQTDLYDNGYGRTTKETYQRSCDRLFPWMDESEQILWMSLLTWQEWRYWFQKEGEITQEEGKPNIYFNNLCIDNWRSCIRSLADYRCFDSWDSPSPDMAILPSRSVAVH